MAVDGDVVRSGVQRRWFRALIRTEPRPLQRRFVGAVSFVISTCRIAAAAANSLDDCDAEDAERELNILFRCNSLQFICRCRNRDTGCNICA